MRLTSQSLDESSQLLFLDLETPFGPKYSLKSLNYDEYIFDPRFKIMGLAAAWNLEPVRFYDEQEVGDFFNSLKHHRNLHIVCHNTYFDGAVMAWKHHINPAGWWDTMSMFKLLHHNKSASLKEMAATLFPNDSSIRKTDELASAYGHLDTWPEEHYQDLVDYTINDVEVMRHCFYAMRRMIPPMEVWSMDDTLRKFFYPQLLLDRDILSAELANQQENKKDVLEHLELTSTQLSSNKQFAELLETEGVTIPTKISPTTGKETYAFSKNDMGFQALQEHTSQYVKDLVQARLLIKSTQVETRAKTLILAHDCHNSWCPIPIKNYAAHTLRFGGMDKRNFQNFPRGGNLRSAIVPPDGYMLYIVDYSAIEARMIAFLSNHIELLRQFRAGEDVYKHMAARIYNVPYEEVDKIQRFIGKVAILGLGYGMGHDKFWYLITSGAMGPPMEITKNQAFQVVQLYRNVNEPIRQYWQLMEQMITKMIMGSISLPESIGPLQFHEDRVILPNQTWIRYSPDQLNKTFGGHMTENFCQALSRVLLVHANYRIWAETGVRSAFHVHDELVYCIHEDRVEDFQRNVESIMVEDKPLWAEELPIAVEGGIHSCYTK